MSLIRWAASIRLFWKPWSSRASVWLKLGLSAHFPARTSIIAAANPVGGHYNKAKNVSENLKMGSALLFRFDLVLILLDTPNEDHDHLLSEHVMAMRAGKNGAVSSAAVTRYSIQESSISILEVSSEKPLADALKDRARVELREKATRSDAEDVVEIMKHRLAERTNKSTFEFQELRQLAKDLQIQVVDFEGFIGAVTEQGYLLKKGHRKYQLQTI